MAISVRLWVRFEVQDDQGNVYTGGKRLTDKPELINLGKEAFLDLRKDIAASTVWDAWVTGAEEPLTDWNFLYAETDLNDCHIELTVDKGGEVGTGVFTVPLDKGRPFILCSDTSYANYTADWASGAQDVIDQIRIRNNDVANTANARLFLGR